MISELGVIKHAYNSGKNGNKTSFFLITFITIFKNNYKLFILYK